MMLCLSEWVAPSSLPAWLILVIALLGVVWLGLPKK